MDKETGVFIEKMFCNLNNKINIVIYLVQQVKNLQLSNIKGSNVSQNSNESKRVVNHYCKIRNNEVALMSKGKTIIPDFTTKIDRMN
jgi:hypothetical protein